MKPNQGMPQAEPYYEQLKAHRARHAAYYAAADKHERANLEGAFLFRWLIEMRMKILSGASPIDRPRLDSRLTQLEIAFCEWRDAIRNSLLFRLLTPEERQAIEADLTVDFDSDPFDRER